MGELDIPLDAYTMDSLYNEKDEKLSLTNEEEIYSNNNQYTRIYKYKDIYYDFNYYMFNDNLYCEIVRFL